MGFHVFNISQQVRRNFHQLLQQKFQSNVNFDWEYFDDETITSLEKFLNAPEDWASTQQAG